MSTDLSPAPTEEQRRPVPPVGQASGRALRLTLGLVLIGAGVVLGLTLLSEASVEVTESQSTFTDVDRLIVDLRADGGVEIRTHGGDEVVVHERVETTVREVRTSQDVSGSELRISSERCQSWLGLFNDRCGASYVVQVPSSIVVSGQVAHGRVTVSGLDGVSDLQVGHGSIEVQQVAGPVRLRTGHGSVTVQQVDGDVVANTGHGDVSVTQATGDSELTTGHGSVTVAQVRGNARIDTGHGSVAVRDIAGTLEIRTSHGTIEAAATQGSAAWLESGHGSITYTPAAAPTSATVTTSHGTVEVGLPRDAGPYAITTDAGDRIADVEVATDPASDHRLEVRTGHGRIRIGYTSS